MKRNRPNKTSSSSRAYAVGYGRPPTHTRFKKGQSGNPNGRRKGQKNMASIVAAVLNRPVTIRFDNKAGRVSSLEASLHSLQMKAIKGDVKAGALMIGLAEKHGLLNRKELKEIFVRFVKPKESN